jgi:glucose dehydrogenase
MSVHETDLCIIGSGVAGALIAARVSGAGIRTLLLETGQEPDRARLTERMNAGRNPYEFRRPPSKSIGPDPFKDALVYAAGGSTWHWVGTAMRLLRDDFRMKTRFGVAVDWPIGYDDLVPHYSRAEVELGVAGDTSSEPERRGGFPLPAFQRSMVDQVMARVSASMGLKIRATPQARNSQPYGGRVQCCSSSTCTPVCPVAAKYDATHHLRIAVGQGARLLTGSTATRIVVGENGRIEKVVFRTEDRETHQVNARFFVLACNAFQIPRLLMLSRTDALPNGVANSSDCVGRFLMDHAMSAVNSTAPAPTYPGRGPRQTSHIADYAVSVDRRAQSAFNLEIMNTQAFPRKIARQQIAKGLVGDALQERVRHEAQHRLRIKALLEVLPDERNRITLDPENRDHLGDDGIRQYFDVGDYCRAGARNALEVMKDILDKGGCSDIEGRGWGKRGMHIAGTARMGSDPRRSVVDPTLRAHDHDNLYIAGSATFPTIGMANPTLTVAALALRLGDELLRRLSVGSSIGSPDAGADHPGAIQPQAD